jgi:serine/threonine protein kinase
MALENIKDRFISNYNKPGEYFTIHGNTYDIKFTLGTEIKHMKDKFNHANFILREKQFKGFKIFIDENGRLRSDIIFGDTVYYDEIQNILDVSIELKYLRNIKNIDINTYSCNTDSDEKYVYKKLSTRESFINEVRSLLRLENKGCFPKIFSIVRYENVVKGFLMQYIDGIHINGPKYSDDCLKSLRIIHDNGIIHCDLKPSNIMLDINNNIYIIDFGSSNINGTASDHSFTADYYKGDNPTKDEEINVLQDTMKKYA